MILAEDKRVSPPPYSPTAIPCQPERAGNGIRFSELPPNVLLRIVEATFPSYRTVDGLEPQRPCMHTLRSSYLETYLSLVKSPYTSDPFPIGSTEVSYEADSHVPPPIHSLQRETEVFDLFIALKTREDVWLDETYLHLEREDSFNDLFSVIQPRKRIEDLVRYYGLRYGYITLSDSPTCQKHSVHFSQITVSFAPRKVSLSLILPASARRSKQRINIADCTRARDEPLEIAAKKLTKALAARSARILCPVKSTKDKAQPSIHVWTTSEYLAHVARPRHYGGLKDSFQNGLRDCFDLPPPILNMFPNGIDIDALLEYINEMDESSTPEDNNFSDEVVMSVNQESEYEEDKPISDLPSPTFRPTRSNTAPTPTPANERTNMDELLPENSHRVRYDKGACKAFLSGEAQFDKKELEQRLHSLGQGLESRDDDNLPANEFDFLEEIQAYFFEDDDYIWNKNRRASRLCDEVALRRTSSFGVIASSQSLSSHTMFFDEGTSKPRLYPTPRFPSSNAIPSLERTPSAHSNGQTRVDGAGKINQVWEGVSGHSKF
ncbi:hypothetical protein Clacol_008299 [Clathrus columnatus]|uniref:Uncharacterized protein n=1 Tax=Clathrus columnatus TaxID=1419009 RepID=A0AAV5AHC0_9AGAM|nr:hypothetical protein Clacol_008299 [Clathrus columnatus]